MIKVLMMNLASFQTAKARPNKWTKRGGALRGVKMCGSMITLLAARDKSLS